MSRLATDEVRKMKTEIRNVLSLLVALGLVLWAAPERAEADLSCLGFKVPNGSVQVEENRFEVGKTWEQVMTFYRKAYQGSDRIRRFLIVSLPGVTAMHFKNVRDSGSWEGANVSRIKGKIYVFCYPKSAADQQE
jgi:hypothetical protein